MFVVGRLTLHAGGRNAGAAMASSMDIAKISFTGSTTTGKAIQKAATNSNLKEVTLELGGKSPAVVFEDANLQTAIFWSVLGITINSGQVCAATSRAYVHESIADAFIEGLTQKFNEIADTLGADPQEPTTTYGPLVDKEQYDKVLNFIEEGKQQVPTLFGGENKKTKGYYVSPVIFKDPPKDSRVYTEEAFGPILCIRTFKTEDEALAMANNSRYGLAGQYISSPNSPWYCFGKLTRR